MPGLDAVGDEMYALRVDSLSGTKPRPVDLLLILDTAAEFEWFADSRTLLYTTQVRAGAGDALASVGAAPADAHAQ